MMPEVERRTLRDRAYRMVHAVLSAWAARRYRADFDTVERFCLFVGYPRSGHSLIGAMLNAHRHAVISHELDAPPLIRSGCTRDGLYGQIIARASWFNLRGNTTNYRYAIPGQWQGRFESLRVIGDKRGGSVTRSVAADARFLDRVRDLVGVPLRLVHAVRNPFDNIAAISIWHRMSLADSVEYYFRHCDTTSRLPDLTEEDERIDVRHEALIEDPRTELRRLCTFLSLEPTSDYLDACSSVVFDSPTGTRHKVEWDADLLERVKARIEAVPFLREYRFE